MTKIVKKQTEWTVERVEKDFNKFYKDVENLIKKCNLDTYADLPAWLLTEQLAGFLLATVKMRLEESKKIKISPIEMLIDKACGIDKKIKGYNND